MSVSPGSMRFELVKAPARFGELREPWTALWSRADASISGYWRRGRTEEGFREWKSALAAAEAG